MFALALHFGCMILHDRDFFVLLALARSYRTRSAVVLLIERRNDRLGSFRTCAGWVFDSAADRRATGSGGREPDTCFVQSLCLIVRIVDNVTKVVDCYCQEASHLPGA